MGEATITVRGETYGRDEHGVWWQATPPGRYPVPARWGDVLDALHGAWAVPRGIPESPALAAWRYPVLSAEDAAAEERRRGRAP